MTGPKSQTKYLKKTHLYPKDDSFISIERRSGGRQIETNRS